MPTDQDQPVAAGCPDGCHYATRMRGGAPIHVQQCMLCNRIDFDELAEQVKDLVRERDEALAEAERLRELRKAAKAWREHFAPITPGSKWQYPEDRALAAAVDALDVTTPEPKITYMVVKCQIVGNLENWSHSYSDPLCRAYDDRVDAIRDGIEDLGHDDFCIGTLRDGKLFAYGWGMDDFAPEDRASLAEIAHQLDLEVHPDAPPDATEDDPAAHPETSVEPCQAVSPGRDIHEAIAAWHDHVDDGKTQLHEFLGMTWAQYKRWAERGVIPEGSRWACTALSAPRGIQCGFAAGHHPIDAHGKFWDHGNRDRAAFWTGDGPRAGITDQIVLSDADYAEAVAAGEIHERPLPDTRED